MPDKRVLQASVAIIAVVLVSIGIGALIGYYSHPSSRSSSTAQAFEKLVKDADQGISNKLIQEIKAENIRENLRFLTKKPHLAGTQNEVELANYMKTKWLDYGLDSAELAPYEVLLSYPGNESSPNKVQIMEQNGTIVFTSQLKEKILSPDQNQSGVVPPFNAYAPGGNVQGELVYVNYARAEDFKKIEELGVVVGGKIAIARYGRIFRGNKLSEAQKAGAIGIILYSDPADYAINSESSVYPNSWWLPGTGAQRGNVVTRKGDQLTPGYPATTYAYRTPDENVTSELPQIPCHPIGYDDARKLLSKLGGDEAPQDWQGKLNITYNLGPGFKLPYHTQKVKLDVHNRNERRMIYNVIGTIKGSVEPDRYILLGNHRDAWVFGAVDPSSGTAAMLEVVRAFGKLLKEGWRPRRTIKFCSWAAEEYGLVGSTEWVEDNAKILTTRAVAYINVDIAVQGDYVFHGRASPLLKKLMFEATKRVPNPKNSAITVYDEWMVLNPDYKSKSGDIVPYVPILGSGSDFAPFIQQLGVTISDIRYTYNFAYKISSYPLYHTVYETFDMMEQFLDPQFLYHQATARVLSEMARSLSDDLLLPLNAEDYAVSLSIFVDSIKSNYGSKFTAKDIFLDGLFSAVNNFTLQAKTFHDQATTLDKKNPIAVRMWNDCLTFLERAFLDPAGLPDRPLYRHIIFAPSSKDSYAGSVFPGLADLMFDIDVNSSSIQWEAVKKHLSVIVYTIQSAANTLRYTV